MQRYVKKNLTQVFHFTGTVDKWVTFNTPLELIFKKH